MDNSSYINVVVFIIVGIAVIALFLGFIIYFVLSYRNKQKDYNLLQKQKQEIDEHKVLLEKTLNKLEATQAQLIQKEKLAALGELTAGVAHEIQNPLNFVNNFSEINKDLLDELAQAIEEGKSFEVTAIAQEIKENEQKIAHHGKRADAIVKGMLQHSRNTSGEKEFIDVNKLSEEYLRMSYQAMQAKQKDFSATLKTRFDSAVGKFKVAPQDLGRVLLNLFNNAYYAVEQKKQQLNDTFEPIITLSTKKLPNGIEIRVNDNGTGIPEKSIGKIFQPFFTTKPTGEGTGLGLSISYDIITKGHSGEMRFKSEEGKETEFVITLPS